VSFYRIIMLAIVSLFILVAFASELEEAKASWQEFKVTYAKNYNTKEEHDRRFEIFNDNLEFIKNFPAKERGFTVGINEFADMTNEEFRAQFNGMNVTKNPAPSPRFRVRSSAPAEWDWRTKGAVTPVKNQGQCGSCWSFSATGSMEGAWFLKHKQLVSLSEQNLVDCSTAQGNEGCNGGLMDQAFKYVMQNKGIDTEASYPYTATGPNACRFKRAFVGANVQAFHDIPSGSESALLESVYGRPTSVAIDASHQSFQLYSGGVYNEPRCSSTQLDHGVLAVGYGMQGSQAYWLVKNSWGNSWGLRGYIMMSRNRNNQCGIATSASYPVAADSKI
jgi:cathepsin L